MSDLLSIGSSGLTAYRNALTAIGENVANAETPGYARRRVVMEQAGKGAAADIIYRDQVDFQGVATAGVARAWDQFKATEARVAASASGRATVRQQWLTAVETSLDDGATGVGASLTRFFNSAAALAGEPGDTLGRTAMLTTLADTTASFRRTADALGRTSAAVGETAGIEIGSVNQALKALHELNGTIRTTTPNGSARASFEDERDQLIDFISEKIDIVATVNADGTASINSALDSSVSLLNGVGPGLVSMVRAADGRLSIQLSTNGSTTPLPLGAGKLAGLVDVAFQTADRMAQLDALAADFVSAINTWSAGGLDANGAAGTNLLEAPTGAASLRLLVTDPDLVPAASATAPNGNLIALEAVREASGVEDKWGTIVSGHAQALSSARSEAAAANSWRDLSKAALDEVTGIDLDYEAAELLRYQQAYNASARIIQVAREAIDALFAAL